MEGNSEKFWMESKNRKLDGVGVRKKSCLQACNVRPSSPEKRWIDEEHS